MNKKRSAPRFLFLLAWSAAVLMPAVSQSRGGGSIVFAEGREFSVVRAGTVKRFDLAEDGHLGFELQDGDLLQTGAATFVELRLRPKGTMLKLAENSSFALRSLGDPSAVGLDLLYGRVRAKVSGLAGGETFTIRSLHTSAGVRGTDFGFDSFIPQSSSAASVRVYAFSGEVSVVPHEAASSRSFPVREGELIAVDVVGAIPIVERRLIDDALRSYWTVNGFKNAGLPVSAGPGSPAAPVPAALAAAPAAPAASPSAPPGSASEMRYAPPDFRPYRSALVAKNTAIGTSAVFNALGVALMAFGASIASSSGSDWGPQLLWGGGVLVGLSTATLAVSFFASNSPGGK